MTIVALHAKDMATVWRNATREEAAAPRRAHHVGDMIVVDDLVPLLAQALAKIPALIRRGPLKELRRTEEPFRDESAM